MRRNEPIFRKQEWHTTKHAVPVTTFLARFVQSPELRDPPNRAMHSRWKYCAMRSPSEHVCTSSSHSQHRTQSTSMRQSYVREELMRPCVSSCAISGTARSAQSCNALSVEVLCHALAVCAMRSPSHSQHRTQNLSQNAPKLCASRAHASMRLKLCNQMLRVTA